MTPELEAHLRNRLREGKRPRDVIAGMLAVGAIKSAKQAWATLEKWHARGEYEYGVSLDLGQLTELRLTAARTVTLDWPPKERS